MSSRTGLKRGHISCGNGNLIFIITDINRARTQPGFQCKSVTMGKMGAEIKKIIRKFPEILVNSNPSQMQKFRKLSTEGCQCHL